MDIKIGFEVIAPKTMVISVPEGTDVAAEAGKVASAVAREMRGVLTGVVHWEAHDPDGAVRFGGSAV